MNDAVETGNTYVDLRKPGATGEVTKILINEKTVDSASDERVVNNVMRHEYRVLGDAEKLQMKTIKDKGLEFVEYLESVGYSREMTIATTKIEEAVMWAVKHVTR